MVRPAAVQQDYSAPLRGMMIRRRVDLQPATPPANGEATNGAAHAATNGHAAAERRADSISEFRLPFATATVKRPAGDTFTSAFVRVLDRVLDRDEAEHPQPAVKPKVNSGTNGHAPVPCTPLELEARAKAVSAESSQLLQGNRLFAASRLAAAIEGAGDPKAQGGIECIRTGAKTPGYFQASTRGAQSITLKYFDASDFVMQMAEAIAVGREVSDLRLYRAFQGRERLASQRSVNYIQAVSLRVNLGNEFDSILRDDLRAERGRSVKPRYSPKAHMQIFSNAIELYSMAAETGSVLVLGAAGCTGIAQQACYHAGRLFDDLVFRIKGVFDTRDLLFSAARLASSSLSIGLREKHADWGRRVRVMLKFVDPADSATVDMHNYVAGAMDSVAVFAEKAVRGRKDGFAGLDETLRAGEEQAVMTTNRDYADLVSRLVPSSIYRAA